MNHVKSIAGRARKLVKDVMFYIDKKTAKVIESKLSDADQKKKMPSNYQSEADLKKLVEAVAYKY